MTNPNKTKGSSAERAVVERLCKRCEKPRPAGRTSYTPDEPQCPQGWPINPDTGQRDGPCGLIGCCARPGPQSNASNEDATEMTDLAAPQPGDHPHTDPGDGRTECERCGKYVWPAIHSCKGVPVTDRAKARRTEVKP